ncbi:hypothetical protein KEM54_005198 [Ascosphaera aggregata]|nr:hypothetical protein KEM54_005198 [Ascosphaera aggregata]
MTRARYKKELELTKARVLTSSRIQLAQLQSSTSTAPYSVAASAASSAVHLPSTATPAPFHHPTDPPFNSAYLFQQQQQPPHRPSLEQESEILERLIILRRLNQPLNPLSQEMSSTFGEQGPQEVTGFARLWVP